MPALHNKKRMNELSPLPVELLFNILLLLPAQFLLKYGMLVCKQWYNLIRDPSFIDAHQKKSKAGLLVQYICRPNRSIFLEMNSGELIATRMRIPFLGYLKDSCRGLCLFFADDDSLHIHNPITSQTSKLPSFGIERRTFLFCHLVYIPQKKVHKVIGMCKSFRQYGCHVLTCGVDMAWRKLDVVQTSGFEMFYRVSASVGEVVYAAHSKSHILAIDMCKETTSYIKLPNGVAQQTYSLFSMQDNLTCVVTKNDDVCMWMMDFEEGAWTNVCDIKGICERINLPDHNVFAVGWLDDSYFVFKLQKLQRTKIGPVVAYNVKNGEAWIVGGEEGIDVHLSEIHTNSLVSW